MKHTITMKEVQDMINQGITTFSKKDNSPRGYKTVSASQIKKGSRDKQYNPTKHIDN